MNWLAVYVSVGWLIRAGMIPVILRRQFAPGAGVAWLGIIFLHPYIGLALYMAIGETRLGPHRVERHRELIEYFRSPIRAAHPQHLDALAHLDASYEPMIRQVEKISGLPVLCGNTIDLLADSSAMIDRLVADIDAARSQVHLLYYIFAPDATGQKVADALEAAVRRGVVCRVLADAVASRTFFRRRGLVRRLKAAGVRVAAALPVAPIQRRLPRMDLRNHRKLAVIDDRIALIGSQNVIDADYGGRRGAPWVDLTLRIAGPAVQELAIVFAEDWAFETNEVLEVHTAADGPVPDGTPMQTVPTGPTSSGESFRRVLLGAIQCARERIVLTTPYFVPDEPTLVALLMAADRGVDVTLMMPRKPDHLLTAAAGRAHFSRLLEAGVRVFLYRPGLLHSKTVLIDDTVAIVGTANLDVRSFNLNFELSVLMYGKTAAMRLAQVQAGYLSESCPLDPAQWAARPAVRRYIDSAISLLSPLL